MTEQDALLEAVFKAPRDDTPRLVYADWLDEHGEGLYAEFIRVQIAREKIATKTPERDKLLKQENAVWKKLKRRWADLFEGWKAEKGAFTRGFHAGTVDDEVFLSDDAFVASSPRWWPWLPIRHLHPFTTDHFHDAFLECDHLRRLTKLRLNLYGTNSPANTLRDEFTVALFGCTRFERLLELEVSRVALSRAAADAMRASPFLDNLRRLAIDYYCVRHSAWMQFPDGMYNKPALPRVKRGQIAAELRKDLRSLSRYYLVVPPGETLYHRMIEATQQARGD